MKHAVVVGGGIVGAACADAAARAGWRVTVLDPNPVGSGATAAGMGHLVVMDDSAAQLALTARSVELWRELAPHLPATAEYRACGTLWIAQDAQELHGAHEKHAALTEAGVHAETLDGHALKRLEPHLRHGLAGGLRVPGDAVVYAPQVAEFLLQRAGAVVAPAEAAGLERGGVRLTDGSMLRADLIVLAAGVRAAKLAPELPIRARKGHLVITDRHAPSVQHQLVELGYLNSVHGSTDDSVAFNVQPRPTGQLLIGSSRQFGHDDRDIHWPLLRRMLDRAVAFLPALRHVNALRIWTGQRAATPDHLPLIGPHPDRAGVFVACGHEGLGVTTALATAELLRHHLTDAPTPLDPRAYAPARLTQEAMHA